MTAAARFSPPPVRKVAVGDAAVTLLTHVHGWRIRPPSAVCNALLRAAAPEAAAGPADAGCYYMVSASSAPTLELVCHSLVCQVYLSNRDQTADLVARAEALLYRAICLTADVPVPALRLRNLCHRTGLDWLRGRSWAPLILEGVMTAEDARLAVEAGVDALVVSNHGGRQLDHAWGTIDVLPEVGEAVDGRAAVLLNGGVRTATDVALGARAVGLGKATMWALAVNGRRGVADFLSSLIEDFGRTLALLGAASVDNLNPSRADRRTCHAGARP